MLSLELSSWNIDLDCFYDDEGLLFDYYKYRDYETAMQQQSFFKSYSDAVLDDNMLFDKIRKRNEVELFSECY
ncbi:hypothetical protein [Tortoise microvirus 56]|nr:hypothetical protein [Tortoise microvirus 56]